MFKQIQRIFNNFWQIMDNLAGSVRQPPVATAVATINTVGTVSTVGTVPALWQLWELLVSLGKQPPVVTAAITVVAVSTVGPWLAFATIVAGLGCQKLKNDSDEIRNELKKQEDKIACAKLSIERQKEINAGLSISLRSKFLDGIIKLQILALETDVVLMNIIMTKNTHSTLRWSIATVFGGALMLCSLLRIESNTHAQNPWNTWVPLAFSLFGAASICKYNLQDREDKRGDTAMLQKLSENQTRLLANLRNFPDFAERVGNRRNMASVPMITR